MELHQVRYFLSLARERHFGRAAAACNVTQPALSRAIRQLEYEFGGMLFYRQPGKIELSELGRTLLPRFERVLSEVREAKEDAETHGMAKSVALRLAIMCTIGPPQLVELFRKLDAKVPGLDLKLIDCSGKEAVELLLKDEVDAAIAGLPKYPSGIAVFPLFEERYAIAFYPRHPFERLDSVPLDQLEGENYVERLNCEFEDHHRTLAGAWPFALNIRYRTDREDWVQAMVAAGMGCTILPEFTGLFPGVVTRPVSNPVIAREISVLTVRGRARAPAAQALVGVASSHAWPKSRSRNAST